MKKKLLILSLMMLAFNVGAQIFVQGVSPQNITGNYVHTWADPASGWGTPDFNVYGNYVQDTLMLVDDGTPGTNAQGNPISAEGCNPLINNLSGKIAVIYRNTCSFSSKALNAQNAGAVGVIIINRDPGVIDLLPGADGINVTIPVVMIASNDGQALVAEMQNGPVVVMLGNENIYENNISIYPSEALISKYGSIPYNMAINGYSFKIGFKARNSGYSNNNSFSFNARITDPNGTIVYNHDVNNIGMFGGDIFHLLNYNNTFFPDFTMTNPIVGKYTLTYTASIDGVIDQMESDNVVTSSFYVTNDILSLARQDETIGEVLVNKIQISSSSSYKACMKLNNEYPFASNLNRLSGLNFWIWSTDSTIQNEVITAEISAIISNSPTVTNSSFAAPIGSLAYLYNYNPDTNLVNLSILPDIVLDFHNYHYSICLTTQNPKIGFGYDKDIRYDVNNSPYGYGGIPVSPINTNGNWYSNGWTNSNALSLGIKLTDCSFNPVNQSVTLSSCAPYISPTNQSYTQSGIYNEVVPNIHGCDSILLTINLTILNSEYFFFDTICNGETYMWNGQQYAQPGQYTQTLTNQIGCDSVVTLNLNVNYNDYISITPNPSFGNAPLNVAFANQTQNLNNYNFTWYFGDGTSQQSNSPFLSHIYAQDGYADVTVVAENLTTGCSSSETFNDMIFVIGGVTCTHSATINQSGPLSGCTGDSILLSCNTDATFTYQWNKNGVPVSGATTSSFYPSQSGSYTVTIYQNNCPITSNGISVTLNSLPNVTSISSTGTITPCSGGTMTLSAPSGLSSYLWNTGATTSSINISQSGNYFVTVTNSSGCERTSNVFPVNASNMTPPQVCIVGIDSLTNLNRIVWEKPLTIGIDSFYVYKETNVSNVYSKIGATNYNDLALFLDVNSNPAVQAYRYKISAFDTCGVETNVGDFHKTIHLTINQGVGGAWNLIWSHYEGLTFGSYNIYRGTSLSNMALLTTIQSNLNSYSDLTPPAGAVYYQIEIVNPVNCDPTKSINYSVSRSNIVNNGQVGLIEMNSSSIQVYPNPTNDKLTLKVSNDLIGKTYFITDFAGRIIQQGKLNSTKEHIDLQTVSIGSYFLQVEGKSIKVVKQ
jgi:hypothetical protein